MPHFLDTSDPDFEPRFAALLAQKREADPEVDAEVAAILAEVAARGDAAVIEMTERWDRLRLTPGTLAFSPAELDAAVAAVGAEDRAALELAAERIRAYHERQLPEDARWTDAAGAELGWRWTAVDAAGLYVPGGLASYPSSLLMNAIPARVAGVRRLVVCAPTPDGEANPLVLLAARLAGIDTVYRIGGAQAIAAMAFGTETIRAVDKITGPGNAWVAAAKRRVFGRVGIDMIAGPSEVLVIADRRERPGLAGARPDGAGRARRLGAVDPRHRRRRLRPGGRGGGRGAPGDAGAAARSPGRAGARTARSSRSATGTRPWRWRTASRRSTCRSDGRRRGAGAPGAPCRCDLHRGLHPRGDRRLCRRAEPRAADGALGALLLRALGAGFHEAHHHLPHDPGRAGPHRTGGGAPRPVRGPGGARPFDPRPARPAERG